MSVGDLYVVEKSLIVRREDALLEVPASTRLLLLGAAVSPGEIDVFLTSHLGVVHAASYYRFSSPDARRSGETPYMTRLARWRHGG